ncbi:MAG: VTT domain-containing protein [Desulfobulbaceae bacterium]|nr:VTT domain-containing protein [Desulfobulbaceae bacterium]
MTKLFLKILLGMIFLSLVFIVEFELFGHDFEALFNQQKCIDWFTQIKAYGWLCGIGLLVGDLVLPVPATGIMAALGNVYGILPGAFFGIIGSAGAGFVGYGAARLLGDKGRRYLASDEELDRFQVFFDKWGGAAIILSRILPILPEIMTILAGIARMHPVRFSVSLLLGTVPTCFLFSWIGYSSRSTPVFGIVLAILIPVLLWPIFLRYISIKKPENSN